MAFWNQGILTYPLFGKLLLEQLRYNETVTPFPFMVCSNMHRMVNVLFSHVSTLK